MGWKVGGTKEGQGRKKKKKPLKKDGSHVKRQVLAYNTFYKSHYVNNKKIKIIILTLIISQALISVSVLIP